MLPDMQPYLLRLALRIIMHRERRAVVDIMPLAVAAYRLAARAAA
jgi:hypothetical protein